MSEVKWIKLTLNMFDNPKIKYLRHLPDGDSIVLVWIMLLTLAGKCNAGGLIFLTENIAYNSKMLADELNMEESTITLAIKTFENLDMMQTDDAGFLFVTGWAEHQNLEGMEKIRESKRLAQQRWRAKQKMLVDSNVDITVDSTVTESDNADIDKDIDIDKDKEIYIKVIQHLNEKAGTNFKPSSSKSKTCIHARLAEGFKIDDFITVIDKKCASWIGTDYEKYLRPETLFGTKFEGYLNERGKVNDTGRHSCDGGNSKGTIPAIRYD